MQRFVNDDFTQSYTSEIAWTPAQVADAVSLQDPLVSSEIESMLYNAQMAGIDISDPVAMSGFMDTLMSKVKQIGQVITGGSPVSISTEKGTTVIGPDGVSYTSALPAAATTTAPVQKTFSQTVQEYLKNPYVVAGLIGVPVLLILLNRRKRRRKK